MKKQFRYFIVNKPYGVLSQFTDSEGRKTIADLYNFQKDVYPVGRLDYDSEGLLLLTNDKSLNDLLLNPKNKHEREYYVQVEGIPDKNSLKKLKEGVFIEGRKTLPAKVKIIDKIEIPERNPPIRFRKNIPTTWISISLTEGKNRQVRKMTAAIGFPTLRLIRVRVENVKLDSWNFGDVKEILRGEILLIKN